MFFIQDLIHEAMMDVDTSGEGPRQITDQLLERRRSLIGIPTQDLK